MFLLEVYLTFFFCYRLELWKETKLCLGLFEELASTIFLLVRELCWQDTVLLQSNKPSEFFFNFRKEGGFVFVLTATLIKKKKKRVPKTTVLITIYTFPLAAATARSAPGQQKNPNETDLLELSPVSFFVWFGQGCFILDDL